VTPESADLWHRARQALDTAILLADRDPDAAASRAYYAAFYAVSVLLAFANRSFRKHSAVERAVHRDLVKNGTWSPEVGAAFSWLSTLRFTGDYGGAQHVQPDEARQAIEKAHLVLQAVQRSAPEPLDTP
jgi:uncharacterized protein (UPF0332 family)